jgi:hypothetical protein
VRVGDEKRTLGPGEEAVARPGQLHAWRNETAEPGFVRPEDVAGSIPCGDSVDAEAEAAGAFFKAGFTDLALVQIGGTELEQDRFFEAAPELITALKETAG